MVVNDDDDPFCSTYTSLTILLANSLTARIEEGKDWIECVRPVIEARMQKLASSSFLLNSEVVDN